jgi:putative hydrolase of HD superfamily
MDALLYVFQLAGRLKRVPRTGWVENRIPHPESVAGHSWRAAVIALVVPFKPPVNKARLIQMALLHDLPEAEIGDMVSERGTEPVDEEVRKKKRELERECIEGISTLLEDPGILEVWEEHERRTTREARLLKEIDKLEMVLTALDYEWATRKPLDSFWRNVQGQISDPQLREILETAETMRPDPVSPVPLIGLLNHASALKAIDRLGWPKSGVLGVESEADHAFRTAIMAWLLGKRVKKGLPRLDVDRLIQMALVHSLSKAILGDRPVEDGRTIDHEAIREKECEENRFYQQLANTEIQDLWKELRIKQSGEARLLDQIDRIEMAMTALEFENEQADLQRFWDNASLHVKNRYLRCLLARLEQKRLANR